MFLIVDMYGAPNNGGGGGDCNIIHNNQKGASYCVENVVAVDNQCVQYEYEYNNQPRVTGIDTQSRKNGLYQCVRDQV